LAGQARLKALTAAEKEKEKKHSVTVSINDLFGFYLHPHN